MRNITNWVILLLALPLWLRAQTSTGEIDVTVLDATSAVIPGAEVKITRADTGSVLRTLTTNESGRAIAPLLPPQTYTIAISAGGFNSLVRQGIVVLVGETVTLQVTLELGNANQSVTVVGETPLIEEKSLTLAAVMEEKQILQLPLNGRNYLQ